MDIVERLRTLTVYNWHTVTEIDKEEVLTPLFLFLNQAADEIERLREVLEEIQSTPYEWEWDKETNFPFIIDTHGQIARKALGQK